MRIRISKSGGGSLSLSVFFCTILNYKLMWLLELCCNNTLNELVLFQQQIISIFGGIRRLLSYRIHIKVYYNTPSHSKYILCSDIKAPCKSFNKEKDLPHCFKKNLNPFI